MENGQILAKLFVIYIFLDYKVFAEQIMCSRCKGHNQSLEKCQNKPPNPTVCASIPGSTQYCMIMREYNSADKLVGFVRDCTPNKAEKETCRNNEVSEGDQTPAKICWKTCAEDGCNTALPFHKNKIIHYIITSVILLSKQFAQFIF